MAPRGEEQELQRLLEPDLTKTESQAKAVTRAASSFERLMDDAALIRLMEAGTTEAQAYDVVKRYITTNFPARDEVELDKKVEMYMRLRGSNPENLLNALKNRFRAKIEGSGGPQMSATLNLTEDQAKAAKGGVIPWRLTDDQAILRVIQENPDLKTSQIADLMLYGWAPGGESVHEMLTTTPTGKLKDYAWKIDPEIRDLLETKKAEQQVGPPSKRTTPGTLAEKAFHFMMEAPAVLGSAPGGALEGGLAPLLEATGGTPYETPAEEPFYEMKPGGVPYRLAKGAVDTLPATLLTAVAPGIAPLVTSLPPVKEAIAFDTHPTYLAETPADLLPLPPGVETMVVDPLETLIKGKVPQTRFSGVPAGKAVGMMAKHPRLFNKALMGAVGGAGEAMDSHARTTQTRKNINMAMENMQSEAERMVMEKAQREGFSGEMADLTPEIETVKRRLMARDKTPSWDPAARQFLQETALDPSTFVAALNPLGIAGKAALKGGVAARQGYGRALDVIQRTLPQTKVGQFKKIRKLGRGIEGAVKFHPEADAMTRSAVMSSDPVQAQNLETMAAGMRIGKAKSSTEARKMFEPARELQRQLPRAGSKRSKAVAEEIILGSEMKGDPLGAWVGGDRALHHPLARPKHLGKDLETAQKLADTYAGDIQEQLGFRRQVDPDTGVVVETHRQKQHAPTAVRKMTPEAQEYERWYGDIDPPVHTGRFGAMTEAHSKKDPRGALMDLTSQWDRVFRTGEARAGAHKELKFLRKTAEHAGMIDLVDRPQVIAINRVLQSARSGVAQLEKRLKPIAVQHVKNQNSWKSKALWRTEEAAKLRHGKQEGVQVYKWDKDRVAGLRREEVVAEKAVRATAEETGRLQRKIDAGNNLIKKFEAERLTASKSLGDLPVKLDRLTREWGVEAVPLDMGDHLVAEAVKKNIEMPGKIFEAITGTIGKSNVLEKITVVPRPVRQRINTITMTGIPQDDAVNAVGRLFDHFTRGVIRPTGRMWRMSKTLVALPYYMMNAFGAAGLSTLSLGLRAFNPKLQIGAIQAAIMSGGLFEEAIRTQPFRTRAGVDTTIGELVDAANRMGSIDLHEYRLALGMQPHGPIDRAMKVAEDTLFKLKPPGVFGKASEKLGLSKISPANINRIIDNYQHLIAFAGFVDDPKSFSSLLRASDLVAKWSGDYRRLGTFEKSHMRETLGFYSWYRFILPHIITQTFQNPTRMAQYTRLRHYWENRWGDQAPVFSEAIQSYGRDFGVTGPPDVQPPEGTRHPILGTHEFAIGLPEDPQQMGASLARQMFSPLGLDVDSPPSQLLGPWPTFLYELFSMTDMRTGRPLAARLAQEHGDIRLWEKGGQGAPSEWARNTALGKCAFGFVQRPSRSYENIARLYWAEGRQADAVDHYMRLKAGQDMAGLDHVLAQVLVGVEMAWGLDLGTLSFKPLSVGGFFQTGYPLRFYGADTSRQLNLNVTSGEQGARSQ